LAVGDNKRCTGEKITGAEEKTQTQKVAPEKNKRRKKGGDSVIRIDLKSRRRTEKKRKGLVAKTLKGNGARKSQSFGRKQGGATNVRRPKVRKGIQRRAG